MKENIEDNKAFYLIEDGEISIFPNDQIKGKKPAIKKKKG